MKAVVTGKDFPILEDVTIDFGESQGNNRLWGENLLARDKVLYKGHAIAAVAATSPHIAEEALGLIEVDYEVLPVVLTVFDAMKDDAPLIHDGLTTWNVPQRFRAGPTPASRATSPATFSSSVATSKRASARPT